METMQRKLLIDLRPSVLNIISQKARKRSVGTKIVQNGPTKAQMICAQKVGHKQKVNEKE